LKLARVLIDGAYSVARLPFAQPSPPLLQFISA
jgi:hypothetical protein